MHCKKPKVNPKYHSHLVIQYVLWEWIEICNLSQTNQIQLSPSYDQHSLSWTKMNMCWFQLSPPLADLTPPFSATFQCHPSLLLSIAHGYCSETGGMVSDPALLEKQKLFDAGKSQFSKQLQSQHYTYRASSSTHTKFEVNSWGENQM